MHRISHSNFLSKLKFSHFYSGCTRNISLSENRLLSNSAKNSTKKAKIGGLYVLGSISLGAGIAGTACAFAWRQYQQTNLNDDNSMVQLPKAGQVIEGLPEFSIAEVAEHKTAQSGVWVMYGDGVYDITGFLELHPGGHDKLMLAAGKSLEPFWEVYSVHEYEEIYSTVEEWRIGNVAQMDRGKNKQIDGGNLYANEPIRSPMLFSIMKTPFLGEAPMTLLANSFLTPNHLFYVRNHFPVPVVDPQEFLLEISGDGISTVKLTLDELKSKFTEYTITAALQCAGNRQNDLSKVRPIKLECQGGFIGNAEWTGVRLRDVLLYAGIKEVEEYTPLQHVHLEGLDHDPLTKETYGASIPIHKAMDKRGDCLLAYKMNGEEIPRDHGYPLRAIVPGTVGARNVKWLTRVVASKEEHREVWQQILYKGLPPSADWSNVSTAPAIQEMPVQSIIYSPEEGASLNTNSVTMSGVAWSGGGRGIIRVDISCDGGKTWQTADLLEGSNQTSRRAWAWTLWTATIQVPSKGEVELCCKAVDTSYNVQPDTSAPLWNTRGYLSNAWHRILVNVKS